MPESTCDSLSNSLITSLYLHNNNFSPLAWYFDTALTHLWQCLATYSRWTCIFIRSCICNRNSEAPIYAQAILMCLRDALWRICYWIRVKLCCSGDLNGICGCCLQKSKQTLANNSLKDLQCQSLKTSGHICHTETLLNQAFCKLHQWCTSSCAMFIWRIWFLIRPC